MVPQPLRLTGSIVQERQRLAVSSHLVGAGPPAQTQERMVAGDGSSRLDLGERLRIAAAEDLDPRELPVRLPREVRPPRPSRDREGLLQRGGGFLIPATGRVGER